MPNKTIYVSDDDLPLLERAQGLSRNNLSSTIAEALRQFVVTAETRQVGYREITVRVGGADGTRRQRFRGRRLARWRHLSAQGQRAEIFGVYRTEHGRFAVHVARGPEWLTWADPEDDGPSMQRMIAWRERLAGRMRMSGHALPPRPPMPPTPPGPPGRTTPQGPPESAGPPGPPCPPRPSDWEGFREAWPASGGNAAEFGGPVELTLHVHDSLEEMREAYPGELCDLVARALDTPEVEDLDI